MGKTKIGALLNKAKKEIKTDREKQALGLIKSSLKNIVSAEKTLKAMKKKHKEILNMNLEDMDDEDFVYDDEDLN